MRRRSAPSTASNRESSTTRWGASRTAMSAAVAAVPPRRPTYAYGESAGGLLAARLAQRGSVRAAAVQSPVANLPFFIGLVQSGSPFSIATILDVPTLAEQKCYSPVHNRTRNPVFATAAMEDALTPPTLRWARKARRVLAVTVPGDHLGSTGLLYPSRVQFCSAGLPAGQERASAATLISGRADGNDG